MPQTLAPPIYNASRDGLIAKYSPSFSGDLQIVVPIFGSYQGDAVHAASLLIDNFNGSGSINYLVGGESGYIPPYTAETIDVTHGDVVILTATDSYTIGLSLYNRPVSISRTRGLTPSGIYDPLWSNVMALFHFDSANGAASSPDSKNPGQSIMGTGATLPFISTAKPQFGSASAHCTGTQKYSCGETFASSQNYGANITWEFSVFPVSAFASGSANCPDGYNNIVAITDGTANDYFIAYQTNGTNIRFVFYRTLFNGTQVVLCQTPYSYSLNPATYYQIAVTTGGGNVCIFVNGAQAVSVAGSISNIYGYAYLFPNNDTYPGNTYWSGEMYVDELRLTVGNRYPQNYTPAGQAFPNQ